jgi:hypothetical protein
MHACDVGGATDASTRGQQATERLQQMAEQQQQQQGTVSMSSADT